MGSTLQTYRRTAAAQLGPLYVGTATSGSLTSALEVATWPLLSTLSQDDLFVDQFVFRPSASAAADRTRVVKSYAPSTGVLTPDTAWTNSPYAAGVGETVELHGLLPPVIDGVNDLHAILNLVLQRLPVRVEFTLTPASTTAVRHSLATAASWLREPWQVRAAGYLASGESRTNVNPFGQDRLRTGKVLKDGNVLFLEGFSMGQTTDTIYVEAAADAYDFCAASGGSYGSQVGLSLDTDVAIPEPDWVAMGVLVETWNRYKVLMDMSANKRVIADRAEAAARLSELTDKYFTMPPQRFDSAATGVRPLVFGPAQRWGWSGTAGWSG